MKEHSNLKTIVYNKIMEDILSNNFDITQVLTEKMLIERYGYSKSPVREALVMLCNDNVLRAIPRYGYEIIRFSSHDVIEMLQFRFLLEKSALVHCCGNLLPQQIDALKQLDKSCQITSDMWEHWKNNSYFHIKLISFLNNQYMCQMFQNCMNRLKIAYAQFYWDKWSDTTVPFDTQNHRFIISALEKGDLETAISKLYDDLNDFGDIRFSENLKI